MDRSFNRIAVAQRYAWANKYADIPRPGEAADGAIAARRARALMPGRPALRGAVQPIVRLRSRSATRPTSAPPSRKAGGGCGAARNSPRSRDHAITRSHDHAIIES